MPLGNVPGWNKITECYKLTRGSQPDHHPSFSDSLMSWLFYLICQVFLGVWLIRKIWLLGNSSLAFASPRSVGEISVSFL